MRLAKLVFLASAMTLAMGGAYAADKQAKANSAEPGFNNLDKNHDGYISRSEARADKDLAKKFKEADTNHDGKLSRAEYLKVKGKEDLSKAAEKVKEAGRDIKNKVSSSKSEPSPSTGGTSSTAK